MRVFACGFALIAGLLVSACSEESTSEASAVKAPRKPVTIQGALKPAVAKKSSSSPIGSWEFDWDAFVDENWEKLLKQAAPGIAAIRDQHARIAAMPPEEREEAERVMNARLTDDQKDVVAAVREGPEKMKEWAKAQMRKQIANARFEMVFGADGSCSVSLSMMGIESDAKGTWDQSGESVTLRMSVVDGKPAKPKDREPKTVTLRDDRIRVEFAKGAPILIAKRK